MNATLLQRLVKGGEQPQRVCVTVERLKIAPATVSPTRGKRRRVSA
ncbi:MULTISPECIES: hypothetical protein [Rhizobium]|uniref:Uncharacterized protein n=1 Tax=Rhizobium paranaense TaxID=1650438 RepID=A0A7W8XXI3_9HYPH|nr:hypothetical protein [Rhizobium paranaense]MBB5577407.1 hypothetical protein [Rhizobium paranaense]